MLDDYTLQQEQAERLYSEGNVLEAIDQLMELNKANPNEKLEQRIMEMRMQGFFKKRYKDPLEQWPPSAERQLCDIGTIPEIESRALTPELLKNGVIGHGALILRNFCDQPFIDKMKTNIDRSMEAYDLYQAGKPLLELAPWYHPVDAPNKDEFRIENAWARKAAGVFGASSPRSMFDLLGEIENTNLIESIEHYFGERPALSVKKTTLRRVPRDSNAGWHQDGAFLGENIRTVNLWIALTDCGSTAPSMDMVPLRLNEIVPTGTDNADYSWTVNNDLAIRVSGPTPPQRLHFKAGDAILFDEMNLHRTGVSPGMTNDRYAIEAWFFAPSKYPTDQLPILV